MVIVTPTVGADAVAVVAIDDFFLIGGFGIGGAEIAVEVFLTRQIGAPGRLAGAAIVHGAERHCAGRISFGFQEIMAGSRADDLHRRVVGDTAVERAVLDNGPTVVALGDFHDGYALQVLQLQNIIGIGWNAVLRCGQVDVSVGVFVVDDDQLATAERERLHAVGVFAEDAVGFLHRATIGHIVTVGIGE